MTKEKTPKADQLRQMREEQAKGWESPASKRRKAAQAPDKPYWKQQLAGVRSGRPRKSGRSR